MSAPTVREAVFAHLRTRGEVVVFGNPGSTELPMLAELPEDVRFVLGLQEAVVVAMADGWAAGAGRPALVNLHTAPGLGNAMGAVVGAQANRNPLVLVVGQQDRRHLATEPYLSGRLVELAAPYVKWAHEPARAADVPAALARALDLAALPPAGPVLLSVPMDDWDAPAEAVAAREVVAPGAPAARGLAALAARLRAAARPALVAGAGIDRAGAWDAAVALAEHLDAPVYAEPLASRSAFPRGHPRFAGDLDVTQAGLAAQLAAHDVVVVLGAPAFRAYPYAAGPAAREVAWVACVTDDPEEAARADAQLALVGDVGAALEALRAAVPARPPAAAAPARPPAPPPAAEDPPSADLVLQALVERLPEDAIVSEELPSMQAEVQGRLPMAVPGSHHAGASGGLGFALPAAVGLKLARPQRTVVCVTGEGSAMYGIQALWTAAREGVALPVLVLDNGRYGILEAFGRRLGLSGLPSLRLGGLDVVALAAGFGCPAERVADVAGLGPALDRALAAPGPYVLHVLVREDVGELFG